MNQREKLWVAVIVLIVAVGVIMLHGCGGKKGPPVATANAAGMANNGEDDSSNGLVWSFRETTDEVWQVNQVNVKHTAGLALIVDPYQDEWQEVGPGEFVQLKTKIIRVDYNGSAPQDVDLRLDCRADQPRGVVYYFPSYSSGSGFSIFDVSESQTAFTPPPGAVAINGQIALPIPHEGLLASQRLLPGHSMDPYLHSKTGDEINGKPCYDALPDPTGIGLVARIPPDAKKGSVYVFRGMLRLGSERDVFTFPYADKVSVR